MKKNRIYLPLLLAAALGACAPEAAELFEDAQAAFETADFNSARISLVNALEVEPGNDEMKVLLAKTLVALGDGEGAVLRLSQVPEAKQKEPELVLLRAEADVLRGKFEEALKGVEGLDNAAADRIRALAYIGQERFAEAAAAFEAGAGREMPDARLFAAYSRFQLARDDTASALVLANKALEQDAKLADALLARGAAYQRLNELQKALADYDTTLANQSANFDAVLGKAQVLAKMGMSKDAAALVAVLKQQDPNSPEVAFVEARIAANDGKWQRVRDILQKHETAVRGNTDAISLYADALIELDVPGYALNYLLPELERRPGSRVVRRLVSRAQLAAGEADDALSTIRTLASRPDASPEELSVAAAAAKATGNATTARTFEDRLKATTPQWVGGELAKADRALRNQQWAEAEKSYQAILSRGGGKNAMVLNNLAFVQEKSGKTEAALKNALEAVKLQPDNASILDTAGWLLVQTGSKQRGIDMLAKAAKLDPDNQTIAQHLSKARTL